MKKNKMMRLASFLLVATLLTTSMISGTFAKYVSTATGTDSARVAIWDIKLEDAAISNTFDFTIFDTVKDSDGSAETDVVNKKGDAKTVIAPGTSGSFEINLKNDSEVTAKYAVDYTLTNPNNIPVEFSIDGTHWFSDINYIDSQNGALAINGTDTVEVQWHWVFERGQDQQDTDFGLAAQNNDIELAVEAKVTVEQVD